MNLHWFLRETQNIYFLLSQDLQISFPFKKVR